MPSNTFKLNTMKRKRQQNNFRYSERGFECLNDVAVREREREEMYGQEMDAISKRLASNAELVAANCENFQMNAQNVMMKDQQLVQMQTQVVAYADNMRQKDEVIEDLKKKLKDERGRLNQVQTLMSMDMDQLRMISEDTELRLNNEVIEQDEPS